MTESQRKRRNGLYWDAVEILEGRDPLPSLAEVARKQAFARARKEHEKALALWSRIRWMVVIATGRAEVELLRKFDADGNLVKEEDDHAVLETEKVSEGETGAEAISGKGEVDAHGQGHSEDGGDP